MKRELPIKIKIIGEEAKKAADRRGWRRRS